MSLHRFTGTRLLPVTLYRFERLTTDSQVPPCGKLNKYNNRSSPSSRQDEDDYLCVGPDTSSEPQKTTVGGPCNWTGFVRVCVCVCARRGGDLCPFSCGTEFTRKTVNCSKPCCAFFVLFRLFLLLLNRPLSHSLV